MRLKKGNYYKVVGGDFGCFYNGRDWIRFECIGCMLASNLLQPGARLQGSYLDRPKARDAMRQSRTVYHHDRDLHKAWLLASKPLPFKHDLVNRYHLEKGKGA